MNRFIPFFAIVLAFLAFTNFTSEPRIRAEGLIIGVDAKRCTCCGGWEIQIDDNVYLANSISEGIFDLDAKGYPIYPQKVYLEYELEKKQCSNRIKILYIERIE